MGIEHVWSAADTDGIRECRRIGCTVRTAQRGNVWQRKKGAHWKIVVPLFGEGTPIPRCAGEVAPDPERP